MDEYCTESTEEMHFFYDAQSRPAFVEFDGAMYRYIHNLQGDIVAIVDTAGNLVVEYKYDAWGKLLSSTGTLKTTLGELNPFGYRGYVYDEESRHYYLRSRYYLPNSFRFINADTVLSCRGSMFKHNIFSYCANKCVQCKDVDGKGLASILLNLFAPDSFGEKIFDWYIHGFGDKRITVSKKWAEYLFDNSDLQTQINCKISKAMDAKYSSGFVVGEKYPIKITFHAEVGNGEAAKGYQFLHGTESTVGDFEICGEFSFEPNGDELLALFNVDCVWNDIIDPNSQYVTDIIKNAAVEVLTLGAAEPYKIHVAWNMDNFGVYDYEGVHIDPLELWNR